MSANRTLRSPGTRHAFFPRMRTTILVVVLAALVPASAVAQSSAQPSGDFDDLPVPSWAAGIIDSFDKPVHPVIGSVVSGGGVGLGVGIDSPDDEPLYKEAEAMVTVRGYWALAGEIGRRSASKRAQIGAFGAVRHMNRMDFFGIGPDTSEDFRSDFRLRDSAFGTRGWFRPVQALRLGGSASMYVPDLGRGKNSSVPDIDQLFPVSEIPGGFDEVTFGRFRGFAELTYPVPPELDVADDADSTAYRGIYQVAVETNRDFDEGRHDFHRWEAEVQQRIPGFKSGQRLTLHGLVASTNTDADVPFYMLYTLGGSGGLKAFRPDLIGSDGTRATLRGFRSFRFRDRDLVLMQAEYRIPLHRYVHSTVFVDAGQVAPRTSELFKELRTSTGFSLSYVRGGRTLGRMDVGFGGGEGVQVFWSFGAFN